MNGDGQLYVYLIIQSRGDVCLFAEEAYWIRENAEAAIEEYRNSYPIDEDVSFYIQTVKVQDAASYLILYNDRKT